MWEDGLACHGLSDHVITVCEGYRLLNTRTRTKDTTELCRPVELWFLCFFVTLNFKKQNGLWADLVFYVNHQLKWVISCRIQFDLSHRMGRNRPIAVVLTSTVLPEKRLTQIFPHSQWLWSKSSNICSSISILVLIIIKLSSYRYK